MSINELFGEARSIKLAMESNPFNYIKGYPANDLDMLLRRGNDKQEVEEKLVPYLKTFINKVAFSDIDGKAKILSFKDYSIYKLIQSPMLNWIDTVELDPFNTELKYLHSSIYSNWTFKTVVLPVHRMFIGDSLNRVCNAYREDQAQEDRSNMNCIIDFCDGWGVHDFAFYIDHLESISKTIGIKRFTLRASHDDAIGGFNESFMNNMLRSQSTKYKTHTSLIHQVGGYVEVNMQIT